ncbi:MAG: hypothetical protein AAGA69_12400 [Pseudomonadota bacterium]
MTGFTVPDLIGYVGVTAVLVAYAGIQTGRIGPDTLVYPVLNAAGAFTILVSLAFHPNMPSIVIEIAWLAISLFGIYRYFLK